MSLEVLKTLDFSPLFLSLHLSCVTLLVLFAIGLPLAWYLSYGRQTYAKAFIEALVALPLILPPSVLGFYLLLLLSEQGLIGEIYFSLLGESLAFSFAGLVVGSSLYSLPFVVQPLQTSFEALGRVPMETAASLRASKLDYFFSIHLFLVKRGLLTAAVLGFAHTMGEFGVVLMIGGNIPGKTQVISIAIYDLVEQLEYTKAHVLSFLMLLFSLTLLFVLFSLNRRSIGKNDVS